MTTAQMQQQQIRLGLQAVGDLSVVGSTNTGVMLFADGANPTPPSRYPIANWCTVTHSATLGSTFKFTRKGIYRFIVVIPLQAGSVDRVVTFGTLDALSGMLAAGVTTTNAVSRAEDYDVVQGAVAAQLTLRLSFFVFITNPLRGSLPLAVNGTAPGTARIHISVDDQSDPPNTSLRLSSVAELFG
jgi:hypothetical protein